MCFPSTAMTSTPQGGHGFCEKCGVDLPILLVSIIAALSIELTATRLKGVANQEERGVMWRYFVERVAAHPYGSGCTLVPV